MRQRVSSLHFCFLTIIRSLSQVLNFGTLAASPPYFSVHLRAFFFLAPLLVIAFGFGDFGRKCNFDFLKFQDSREDQGFQGSDLLLMLWAI